MKNKKNKEKHSYTHNRVILSDTLPYEVPLTFSNRHLYKFLNKYNIIKEKDWLLHSFSNNEIFKKFLNKLIPLKDKENEYSIHFNFHHNYNLFEKTIYYLLQKNNIICFNIEYKDTLKIIINNQTEFLALLKSNKIENCFFNSVFEKHNHFNYETEVVINEIDTEPIAKILTKLLFKKNIGVCNFKHREITLLNTSELIDFLRKNNLHPVNKYKCSEPKHIPFTYRIAHKETDFRELSIPHPVNQLAVISFYKKYKEIILYYCNQSSFSIRKPQAIANYVFVNDKLHEAKKGDETELIEDSESEYESLKTFFTYKKYPNIHRFYEDYRYHRAEKKFNTLFKFDIAKCFDSIYTHSISWAIYQKEIAKKFINKNSCNFPDDFDRLMQSSNYGETNGIIIGPEFSRIFAEIILQSIDKEVESELKKEDNLIFKIDYEVYRYVDDYFVFYNNESDLQKIFTKFKLALKKYKLSVSDSKQEYFEKPIITNLTIAKEKISQFLDNHISIKINKRIDSNLDDLILNINKIVPKSLKQDDYVLANISFKGNSKSLITNLKIILSESKVGYKDILNFTLAAIDKRLTKQITDFDKYNYELIKFQYLCEEYPDKYISDVSFVANKYKAETAFTSHLIQILDFIFFIYAVEPRVNFTIKLCRILSKIISIYSERVKFIDNKKKNDNRDKKKQYESIIKFTNENKQRIFKKISDEIKLVLEKNSIKKYNQIESLYLLIAIQQFGKEFLLTENQLLKYCNISLNSKKQLNFNIEPHYFVITVILFYIRNNKEFSSIKLFIEECIMRKINSKSKADLFKEAESVLLFFDIIVCPYLKDVFKRKLLCAYGIVDIKEQTDYLNFKNHQKYWFTKWDKFNFKKEIEAKIAQEPY